MTNEHFIMKRGKENGEMINGKGKMGNEIWERPNHSLRYLLKLSFLLSLFFSIHHFSISFIHLFLYTRNTCN